MLKLNNITKSYDEKIFDDVSLEFLPGKLYFIVGESGVVKQDSLIFENLTIIENMKIVCDDFKSIVEFINLANLTYCKDKKVKNLSGGEQKRVSVLKSILLGKDIFLFDEPTSNLDIKTVHEIMNLILKVSKDKIIIIVTHDESLCKIYGDVVIRLKKGYIDYYENNKNILEEKELIVSKVKPSFIKQVMLNNKPIYINMKFTMLTIILSILFFNDIKYYSKQF